MITILIVDDEKLERRGIRFLLKREENSRFWKRRMERMHLAY